MDVLTKCVVLVLCLKCVASLNEGDPCMANDVAGVCKVLDDCDYAVKLLSIDEKKPSMCRWRGSTRIVCCPLKDISYTIGAFRNYFSGANNGVLRSQDMTCRYDGNLPIVCCQNVPEVPPPAEPAGCPRLQLPTVDRSDIAFRKCLEYQRYVSACVSSDSNPETYIREDTCGYQAFTDRITEGHPAMRREFPHMALLGCRNTVNTGVGAVVWVAGGSLVSDRFILTAGHVLSHRDYGLLRYALLGATNKSEARDGLLYNIIRFIPHKLYVKNEKKHDIALLELDRRERYATPAAISEARSRLLQLPQYETTQGAARRRDFITEKRVDVRDVTTPYKIIRVEFSEFIRPACLPSPAMAITKDRILAGWGKTGEHNSESQVLLKVSVPEFDYESYCKPFFANSSDIFDKNTMLCAAGGKEDSCQGDSGGPLMTFARDIPCSFIVRGIVSFGPRCGAGVPGVYTNVAPYMPWLLSQIWPNK